MYESTVFSTVPASANKAERSLGRVLVGEMTYGYVLCSVRYAAIYEMSMKQRSNLRVP